MAKQFPAFEEAHTRFIAEQHMFFVATAAATGHVNVSPKGRDSLRVLGPNRLIWLNLTGSGNETAGHLAQVNRMTVMWCSTTTRPLILRAFGTARTLHHDAPDWDDMVAQFGNPPGARQVYDMDVTLVQTSCGYAVPFMEFRSERDTLETWANDKGPEGIRAYWEEKNTQTLDGAPTGIEANW
ncbi:pyridoxamine 5'-phosphate oxidase family protein [Mesobacterium pallidum]|uniref:pyridoxamine 5'-phosphate oxidase family protein n=1 Tax=Mesobacterium pallidum TaxID=2872037 RepID=UPI001EE2384C|nr:pyridoxamine 5'-phosphate oxidase family protein [Mesobacterium pallidum]